MTTGRSRAFIIAGMSDVRELDCRRSGRIEVRLLWRPRDDRVMVAVADERTGRRFTVDVHESERPLDVFRHPYAYAAWHGIDTTHGVAEPMPSA